MSKPKAPAAPDYAAAAVNQGKANVDSAVASNFLNQVNQVGPDGSLTYSYDQTKGYTDPTTGKFIPQATATTSLSPEQQKLYDQNSQISTALNDQAIKGIGYVSSATDKPLTADQFGGLSQAPGVDPSKYITSAGDPNNLATSYDFSKVEKLPTASDFGAQRDQVTNALMARLQPQIDSDRQAQEARLANQGINLGSSAYGTANDQLERNVNDQRMSAVLAGSQEQQRLFGDTMALHTTGVNDAMAQGDFGNAAKSQMFSQGLANANLNNSTQNTLYGQGLSSAQFNNQAQQQAIQEADYFQNQPLNMLNALRSGNQVTQPTFGNVSGGAQVGSAPIYAATSDAAAAQQAAYAQKMGLYGAGLAAVGGMGSAAIKASDRRLKKNIQEIGRKLNGLMVYSFDYIWPGLPQIGYMADEVEKLYPDAVTYTKSGFAAVNYGMVG